MPVFKWLAGVTYKTGRRIVVTVVGGTVLLIGIAMILLPGPAIVVIPIGLAILGLEWAWARRFLGRIREEGDRAFDRVGIWRRKKAAEKASRSRDDGDDGSAGPQ